jgi:C4-dicarboxylate transporter DctQ subunit
MSQRVRAIGGWLVRRAENLLALMLAAMFVAFLVQIVFRYVLNFPIGWTHEISVILWLWLVLFGAGFVVREAEEIRFDIIYGSVGQGPLYGWSLPAMVDYVSFMKVERTAYLKLPFNWVYGVYLAFAVAAIVRYLWLGFRALRGEAPEAFDPTRASSGV